jgi:tetratricopeptide (TPR) repeat protein
VHAEAGGAEVEWTWALAHIWQGTVALLLGDADEAVRLVEAGLQSARRRDDRLTSYIALYNLFQVELGRGDHPAARRHLEEGTRLSLETRDQANLAYLLDAGAVLAAASGQHARVPLLLGAAQSIREALGSQGYGYYRPDPDTIAAAAAEARTHLGADRYDDALDTGRGLAAVDAAAMLREAHPRG